MTTVYMVNILMKVFPALKVRVISQSRDVLTSIIKLKIWYFIILVYLCCAFLTSNVHLLWKATTLMLFNMTIALLVVKINDPPPFNTIFFPRLPPPLSWEKNSGPPQFLLHSPLSVFNDRSLNVNLLWTGDFSRVLRH